MLQLLAILSPLSSALLSLAPAPDDFTIRPIAPLEAADEPTNAWEKPPHRHTVYLNFDGAPLTSGGDGPNAAEGHVPCISSDVDYPAFAGTDELRAEVVDIFTTAVAPFGIRVVHEARPPKHLPYSQVMIGGKPSAIGQVGNSSSFACLIDCGDAWWRETSFVFAEQSSDPIVLAQAALNVAGHGWGLDALEGHEFIMNNTVSWDPRTWSDTCVPVEDLFPAACNSVHKEFCGEGFGLQNDVAELTAMFGTNSVDEVAPTVELLSPVDGAVLVPGQEFVVEAVVNDDFDGAGWKLLIPEVGQEAQAYQRETTWALTAPKGVYTIRVEALDHDGNVGHDEATIYVGVEPEEPTTTTTGEPESTGEAPTTGPDTTTTGPDSPPDESASTTDDSGPGGATTGDGEPATDESESGCTCSSGQAPGNASLGLLLLAWLAPRRRRG